MVNDIPIGDYCVGSFGHPDPRQQLCEMSPAEDLCRAPCVYMLKNGFCQLGFGCGYCHFPHGKKHKLDKGQRSLLRELDVGPVLSASCHT